jgi:phosphoribosylaminoimidazole-succinocarboxamide synthase
MMMHSSALAAYAQYTLAESFIPELPDRYRGKVRENYDLRDGTRILIATDRISAFDRILAAIPLKGMVLTEGGFGVMTQLRHRPPNFAVMHKAAFPTTV